MADNGAHRVRVGVLALQGSFREHMFMLQNIPDVDVLEVRTVEELKSVSGLIIPGGESTTMALIADQWKLTPELKAFADGGNPIWGTCAGMIFLANRAVGQKQGGQKLLGGLDIEVSRNFFGAQINSFETQLPAPTCVKDYGGTDDFRAMFIRAPAVLHVGPGVEVLAKYKLTEEERASQGLQDVAVAVRHGVLMATAFHPELTKDTRWHQLFVDMIRNHSAAAHTGNGTEATVPAAEAPGRAPNRPADMPVYGKKFMSQE